MLKRVWQNNQLRLFIKVGLIMSLFFALALVLIYFIMGQVQLFPFGAYDACVNLTTGEKFTTHRDIGDISATAIRHDWPVCWCCNGFHYCADEPTWIEAKFFPNLRDGWTDCSPSNGIITGPTRTPISHVNCSPCYSVCFPPAPPILDCEQIRYCNFFVYECDPHGFDGDHDGWGCEWGCQ